MTKDELIKKLIELGNINDPDKELRHIDADELLLEYINDVDVTKAFNKIDKWYA